MNKSLEGLLLVGFPIIHPLIKLEIKLEEIGKLHIYEEVIPSILERLTGEIRADGYLKHPVIVDRKTLVVLDGVHRVVAIKNLGCRYIPVCLVEYDNPHLLVGCWYRVVNCSSDLERMISLVRELGFTIEECSKENGLKLVVQHEAVTLIVSRSQCFVVYGPKGTSKEIYNAIRQIELKLKSKGYSISYETESDAQKEVFSKRALSMFVVPPISKKEVVETALRGEAFAHKTTRHVVPARPLFVNIPLEWLRSSLGIKKINEVLVNYLSKKRLERLPSGQVLDRHYEEELYIFR